MTEKELDNAKHKYCSTKKECRDCPLKIGIDRYACNSSEWHNPEAYSLLIDTLMDAGLLKQLAVTEQDIMELLQ